MLRTLSLLILLVACAYQQMTIQAQKAQIRDLIGGLQHDQQVMEDAVWSVPPPPCIPCEEALEVLEHPREQ